MRTVRRYLPVESVTASKLFPLASLTARTTTPGSTPPVWSVTVPLIAASWANADIGSRRNGSARSAAITSRRNEMRDINFLLGMGLPGRCETCRKPLSWRRLYHSQSAVGSGQWAVVGAGLKTRPYIGGVRLQADLERRPESQLQEPRHERDVVVVGREAVARVPLVGDPRAVVRAVEHVEHLEDPVERYAPAEREPALHAHVHARQRAEVEAAPRNQRALAEELRSRRPHAARRPARRAQIGRASCR